MAQPLSQSPSFVAGVNPRLNSSGSVPFMATPPGSPLMQSSSNGALNNGMSPSPPGQSVQEIELQLRLQQEQLVAQQALLEQQQAMIRQQQEMMQQRQQQLDADRQRIAQEQAAQKQRDDEQQAALLAQHQAALAQQQQLALLDAQKAQVAQNGGHTEPNRGATQPLAVLHPHDIDRDAPPPPNDDEAPGSYFDNGGLDYDTIPPPNDEMDIPLPPDDQESTSTASSHAQTMSLTALSDTPVGSIVGGPDVIRTAAQTAPILIQTSGTPAPLLSANSIGDLRTSSPSYPTLSPATASSSFTPLSSSAPVTGHISLSMSSPGSSPSSIRGPLASSSSANTLTSSGNLPRDEEGGFIRPDDLNVFVPIMPIKKDYGAMNAIKDKAIDDLVMFSKNFQIMIKGGTLQKLIERLTFESTTDNDYVDTFLLTYRNFVMPNDLLEQLLDRYRTGSAEINPEGISETEASNTEKKQKIIRMRVGNVLKRWLSDHYHDYHDPALLARVESGIAEIQEPQLQAMLRKTIQEQQLQKNKIRDLMFSKEKPQPILPKGPSFDDWDVVEIARQLCLYEQTIYQAIHPKEALNQNWNKHKDKAPNLLKMIAFFNRMSKWVSTQICLRENFKERVKLIIKFMQLTMQLRQYNNFDCMQAVLSGLNNSSVFRMKASWAKIHKEKFYTTWRTMATEITDTTNNSVNYRQAVSHADPPIIPYLGVYLTDLTFTEDGNSNYLKVQDGREDIVNFEKMRRVAVLIKDICTYQQTPYNFERVPQIYDFFAGELPYEDDNSLFKRSRALEPPDTNNPGQVITPKKSKKSLSFRRISLGVFSKDSDSEASSSSPSSSPKEKKHKKDKK